MNTTLNFSLTPEAIRRGLAGHDNGAESPTAASRRIPAPNFTQERGPPTPVSPRRGTVLTPPNSPTVGRVRARSAHPTNSTQDVDSLQAAVENLRIFDDGPYPVYPRPEGYVHPCDPLPMIAASPYKYWVVFAGTRIGLFYERW